MKKAYGKKRDYRKIDVFVNGRYIASTTWNPTLKDAKAMYTAYAKEILRIDYPNILVKFHR